MTDSYSVGTLFVFILGVMAAAFTIFHQYRKDLLSAKNEHEKGIAKKISIGRAVGLVILLLVAGLSFFRDLKQAHEQLKKSMKDSTEKSEALRGGSVERVKLQRRSDSLLSLINRIGNSQKVALDSTFSIIQKQNTAVKYITGGEGIPKLIITRPNIFHAV